MNRRGFIKRTALALGALVAAPVLKLAGREKTAKKPPFPRGLPPYYPICLSFCHIGSLMHPRQPEGFLYWGK